jgi:hypothetical protein
MIGRQQDDSTYLDRRPIGPGEVDGSESNGGGAFLVTSAVAILVTSTKLV